jgi:arylsulfatase A-like enzyme
MNPWRRNLRALAALFGGLALASWSPAQTPPARRPNILFIVLDDWGWQHSGAYGCDWVKTPAIDRLAREGVQFNHAFTSNPKCSPSRASMLTGRNAWQLEEAMCHNGIFPKKFAVYPDILEAAGYAVGFAGKGWAPGDFASAGWTRNPAGPAFNQFTHDDRPASGISRNDYVRNFSTFLAQRDRAKPFSFWLGIFEPHRGYELNSGVRLGKQLAQVKVPGYLPDLPGVRGDLADYAVEVESADDVIARALEAVAAQGELDNTVVVVTSDNGMPFPFVKGQVHEDAFRLPLIVRWPARVKPGRVVEDFVNMSDLAPTFLELAGVPVPRAMSGRSFVRQLQAAESGWIDRSRAAMVTGKERHDLGRPHDWGYPVRAIRTPEFLYVLNYAPDRWPAGNPETNFPNVDDGPTKAIVTALGGYFFELSFGKRATEELYRLSDDAENLRNLAPDPAFAATKQTLRERMLAQLRAEEDPRALGHGDVFDAYRYTGARAHAYDTWLARQAKAPATAEEKR